MSRVLVKVTGLKVPPYESSELVDADDATLVVLNASTKIPWTCGKSCRSLVSGGEVYRQINPVCGKHRSLIPAEVQS